MLQQLHGLARSCEELWEAKEAKLGQARPTSLSFLISCFSKLPPLNPINTPCSTNFLFYGHLIYFLAALAVAYR